MTQLQDLGRYLQAFSARLEPALKAALGQVEHRYTPELVEAMGYTLYAGGKRIRPAVVALWAETVGGAPEADLLRAGAAVELIHTCSLVLDDLPSMDDAATRRGIPCCHVRYGVDTAILAANAQLMLAFELIGRLEEERRGLHATALLARAVGATGMVGGQHVDLHHDARDLRTLEYIHSHKTGALFQAAAVLGTRLAQGSPEAEAAAGAYARNLGLAFQIKDDLLDATGHAEEMGKDARQDRGKPTFASSLGVPASEEIMRRLLGTAREVLDRAPVANPHLSALCDYVAGRKL